MSEKNRSRNANTSESASDSSGGSRSGDETSADATLAEESSAISSESNVSRKSSRSRDKKKPVSQPPAESRSKIGDYSKFTDLLSDSVLDINSNYDYPKKLVKDYKLDLAAELQTKLDETKTTCVNLERENKRLRKQLQMQNEYEMKTSQVLLKHATDLNEIRAKYRDTKAELEKVKIGMKPLISWRPKKPQSSKRKKPEKSVYSKMGQESSGDEDDEAQINNNRRSSTALYPRRRLSRNRTQHARGTKSKGAHLGVVHRLNSNRRELFPKDPVVILHAPVIGRRLTKRSKSEGHLSRRRRSFDQKQLGLPKNKVSAYRTVRDWQRYNSVSPKKYTTGKNRHSNLRKKPLPIDRRKQSGVRKPSVVWKTSPTLQRKRSPNQLKRGKEGFKSFRYRSFSAPRQSKSVPARNLRRRKISQRRRSQYRRPANKSKNNLEPSNENNHAIRLLNSMLEGVHFNSKKKLFYPGNESNNTNQAGSTSPPANLPFATSTNGGANTPYLGAAATNLGAASAAIIPEHPLKPKASRESVNTKRYVRMIHAKLDDLDNRKKLNKNQMYIKDQYKKLLLSNVRQTGHFLPCKQKPLNLNNNANDSDCSDDTKEPIDQSAPAYQVQASGETPVNVNLTSSSSAIESSQGQTKVNDNTNAVSTVSRLGPTNLNSNASYGGLHPEVSRLQHLLKHKEIQQHDFLSAFTDALVAKEAAVDLAEEQQDTIHMLDREMSKMRDEYEDIIHIKNDELDMQNEVLSSYKDERFSLTKALEKATKCMVEKLQAKNAALRKKNMAHHDEISELRRIALQQEAQVNNLTETLQRAKIFHEREITIFNKKIRQLHDLTKAKEAEIHNYQQISADVVHMAEQMNLDLHIKDEIIKQLRNDLANFEVGLNEVEGDRVLVKQNKTDKRVTSLGFPRIVDGNLIIWYKSRSHGDNFLVLRIFGGKLFVVGKPDIIPELNRILPNLINNPIFTHAALKLDKGTQWPPHKPECPNQSALAMQIHLVGNKAHLAMEGRHLCSQKPILFIDDENEESLRKELTPRPYQTAASDLEKAILLSKVKDKNPKKSGSDFYLGGSSSGSGASGSSEGSSSSGSDDSEGESQSSSGSETEGSEGSNSGSSGSSGSGTTKSSGKNRSSNARTNFTQNAQALTSTSDESRDFGDVDGDVDLDKFTTQLLGDLDTHREQSTADGLGELEEVTPIRHGIEDYDLDWLDESLAQESTKAMCASPRQRLKKVEADINRLNRKHVKLPASTHSAFEPSILTARRDMVLNNEAELTGWKANRLGEDYKFTRLSGDEDLRQFIKEHTLDLEDDGGYEPLPDVLYNEETRRFMLPSRDKTSAAKNTSAHEEKAKDRKSSQKKKSKREKKEK